MLKNIRSQFPILSTKLNNCPLVYLDNAATTQKPLDVLEAMDRFYREEYATVHRAVYSSSLKATEKCENVRKDVASFLSIEDESQIIFTKGTTEAINIVAQGLSKKYLQPLDEILLTEVEHHANLVPWQIAAEASGALLRFIPVNEEGKISLVDLEKLLNSNTKIVSLAHISNVLGTLHPLKEIIDLAHQKGALVFIDGAQAAAHISLNIKELDADFYAFSGHKVYGPTAIGVLYGKKELLEMLPPLQFGGDMIEHVELTKSTFAKPPLKFEAGTPMIAEIIGLGAALHFLKKNASPAWIENLTHYVLEGLSKIEGIKILGPKKGARGALVSFNIENIHPLDIGTFLNFKGIAIRTGHMCAQTAMRRFNITSACRVSLGIYNTKEEIDYFLSSLKTVMEIL
jgi:cysteine desulfurase / selenocysteine lyase